MNSRFAGIRVGWVRVAGAVPLCALAWGCDAGGAFGGDAVLAPDDAAVGEEGESDSNADGEDGAGELPEWHDPYAGMPPGAVPAFDLAGGFFDAPMPSDLHRSGGRIDFSSFPNPSSIALIEQYVGIASSELDGFSPNQVVWFRFDRPIDESLLPSPLGSAGDDSTVWLLDAQADSSEFGSRLPVEAQFFGRTGATYIPDYTLAVRPLPGIPLREGGTYAVVVRRALADVDGHPLATPALLDGLLTAEVVGDGDFERAFGPLRLLVEAGHLNPFEVGVASVFTVGHVTREVAAVRSAIQELPTPEPKGYAFLKSPEDYVLLESTYVAPAFQSGEKPYATEGGGLVFDAQGKPQTTGTELIRFSLALPKGTPPESGWPVVLYGHGTGGNYLTVASSGPQVVAKRLTAVKLAVLSIDQPLHGIRYEGPGDIDLLSFNFTNADAGRTNFRQSAFDFMVLAHMVKGGIELPGKLFEDGEPQRLDGNKIAYLGHSHGGLAGVMLAATEPSIRAYALSGAGGGLAQTLMLRKDPYDLLELITTFIAEAAPSTVTPMHPVIALVQMNVDITDPLNYAPLLASGALRGGTAASVLLTEGLLDQATPSVTSESLAAAAGLRPIAPVVHMSDAMKWFGLDPLLRPIAANWTSDSGAPATGVLLQSADHDHFFIFDDKKAADTYTVFLHSALHSIATIP